MPAPFATLEARSTAAVFRHLANAQAQAITRYSEVVAFPVIFDNASSQAGIGLLGMTGTQPVAMAKTANVVDVAVGCAITISGTDYKVAELQPDGTGMTTLTLERA